MYIERVKWKVFMILLYKNNGESYKLEQYKGDVMLIVNTASDVVLHLNSKVYRSYMMSIRIKDLLF